MSIHTDRSFNIARQKGAASATNRAIWEALMRMSKRELAEIAMHLAAMCAGDSYDISLAGGGENTMSAIVRVLEERDALKTNGLI